MVGGVSNVDPSGGGHEDRHGADPAFNTESYDTITENEVCSVADRPLSTFSIDVDTASYANVRRLLHQGVLPPAGAVRIEELINYFRYDYPLPAGDAPSAETVKLPPTCIDAS